MRDVLMLTQRKQLAFAEAHIQVPLSAPQELAKAALIEQGVSENKAVELVRKFEPFALMDRAEYVASQVNSDRKGSIKNPAGYLISFIEGEQKIPSSFQTRRQKGVAEKHRQETEAAREVENSRCLAQMQIEEEYQNWCLSQAEELITRQFNDEVISQKLREISTQLRKEKRMSEMLDFMKPDARRAELMKFLRKEVLKELSLPSLDEWRSTNVQGDLF
jgi:hypothetical protein